MKRLSAAVAGLLFPGRLSTLVLVPAVTVTLGMALVTGKAGGGRESEAEAAEVT